MTIENMIKREEISNLKAGDIVSLYTPTDNADDDYFIVHSGGLRTGMFGLYKPGTSDAETVDRITTIAEDTVGDTYGTVYAYIKHDRDNFKGWKYANPHMDSIAVLR
tara:strand:+ start:1480 stop:1800 length:321 start_codon:yes stop_codon:yes gene_type:complete